MRRGRARRRILVADDDVDIVKIVRANLEAAGFEIDAVSNGWEAQARALRTTPDAIVLDVSMPGRNGLEVLGGIRARRETRDIPVVLLSARTSDTEIWEGWKAGASYYLTKPFDPDDLVRYVAGLFDAEGCRS
jgi:DNA-binding response OmpR family regulator